MDLLEAGFANSGRRKEWKGIPIQDTESLHTVFVGFAQREMNPLQRAGRSHINYAGVQCFGIQTFLQETLNNGSHIHEHGKDES